MVGVVSYLLQVVVFSRNAQTFLGVGNACIGSLFVPQKNILELIHSGIGKHECGIVLHHHGGRGNDLVIFGFEKIQESFSYLG